MIIVLTAALVWRITGSAQFGPPPINFFEVPFESVSQDLVESFHKKHPNQTGIGTRVTARVAGWKVTHYNIEFPGSDDHTINVVLPVKDVKDLTVEWADRNKDGRVDLQRHFFRGSEDRNEVLTDEDQDGFFDKFTLFGAGIIKKDVRIAVPRRVPAAERTAKSVEK